MASRISEGSVRRAVVPLGTVLQRRDDLVEVASDVVHAHEVLGHLGSEVDDGGGDGRLGLLHPLHRSVPAT